MTDDHIEGVRSWLMGNARHYCCVMASVFKPGGMYSNRWVEAARSETAAQAAIANTKLHRALCGEQRDRAAKREAEAREREDRAAEAVRAAKAWAEAMDNVSRLFHKTPADANKLRTQAVRMDTDSIVKSTAVDVDDAESVEVEVDDGTWTITTENGTKIVIDPKLGEVTIARD
jgi:hypothetical protein